MQIATSLMKLPGCDKLECLFVFHFPCIAIACRVLLLHIFVCLFDLRVYVCVFVEHFPCKTKREDSRLFHVNIIPGKQIISRWIRSTGFSKLHKMHALIIWIARLNKENRSQRAAFFPLTVSIFIQEITKRDWNHCRRCFSFEYYFVSVWFCYNSSNIFILCLFAIEKATTSPMCAILSMAIGDLQDAAFQCGSRRNNNMEHENCSPTLLLWSESNRPFKEILRLNSKYPVC